MMAFNAYDGQVLYPTKGWLKDMRRVDVIRPIDVKYTEHALTLQKTREYRIEG